MSGKRIAAAAITVALVAAVFITGGMSMYIHYIDNKTMMEYELLQPTPAIAKPEQVSEEEQEEVKHYPALYFDFKELEGLNPDFRGWLYFPALSVSYPVVQGEDNKYYLKHSFQQESNHAGCIFMDMEASPDWSDRNTFVFGHNMRDDSMFGQFKYLLKDPTLCAQDPFFYIYTEEGVYIYEIFSVYETASTSDRYMTFESDESYDAYVKWALDNSLFASKRDMSDRGNIVSLSTCYGASGTKKRALIHGALNAVESW